MATLPKPPNESVKDPRKPAAKPKPRDPKPTVNAAQSSAQTQIISTLSMFGLASLGRWAWQQYLSGKTVDQIFLDMRQRPEYKKRFPAMASLSEQGAAITEAQYVQLEISYKQLYHQAGLPSGFYDSPDDFAKLIAGQVAPTELKSRLDLATASALTAPAETRQALQLIYGLSDGDLTAFWIDPDRALPLLQQKFAAAEASGTSARAGYGQLAQDEAERIASVGLSPEALTEGFGRLTAQRQLFGSLPGEADSIIDRQMQIGSLLGDAEAQLTIEDQARRRVAEFADTGRDYATTQAGIVGLGKARV